ncbi:hypothetical protein BYT27DRAFT_7083982 [Phlegmacium glaucopus]|nr:hypothetical protein BYT27DRAFT_7083982 [Phlegmacium glaucopus]
MIVLDDAADRLKDDKFNGLTLRHLQAVYIRSTSPLPDYDTSEAQHHKVPTPSSKFKLDAKTWRAALYSLGIYIFLTLVIAVPIIVLATDYYGHGYNPTPPLWPIDDANQLPPYKLAIAGMTPSSAKMTCNNWQLDSNSPNSVVAFFNLPPTGLITIRSNATNNSVNPDQLNGALSVSMNSYSNESSVLFMVEMRSSSIYIQNQTKVCFSEGGNNRGLSIYVPSNMGGENLAFNISVILPQVNSNVDNFVTNLPMFSQTYGDLRQYLSFGQFTLQGSSRPIFCKSLQALQILVTNILAPIQGSFTVADKLVLDSIKSPIIADVTLSPKPVQTRPTILQLSTGDSAINASITLNAPLTTSIPSFSPAFVAQINNFNGPLQLHVAYEKASPASPFQLQIQNNVDQSTIHMDDRFQGCFYVQTKLSEVFIQSSMDLQKNASQILDYDVETPCKAMGWVGWDRRPMSGHIACQSSVTVLSALGPVNLTFGL